MPVDRSGHRYMLSAFSQYAELSAEEQRVMKEHLISRSFSRGELIVAIGEVEQYLSMVTVGMCRCYYQKSEDEEVSVAFAFEGDYVSAYYSFLTQRPSLMAIEALTDVELVCMSKVDLDKLCALYPKAERIGRLNAERIYRRKEEREIDLLTKSATERYIELVERSPQVLQHIPLKHIASYLGIKPESLSRIRKQLAKDA